MSVVEPKQIWWTVEELATSSLPELPGSKPGINLLAQRFDWRAIEGCAKRKVGRGGGWIYHWSVLPLAARRKLLIDASETPDTRPDRGTAWAVFDRQPETTKAKAKARLGALQIVDGLHLSGVTHVHAVSEAARQCGASARSIYNWLGMVEGIAPEDRLAYLVPRNRLAKRAPTRATCNRAFMDYLKSLYLRLEQPTYAQCYRDACAKAKHEGWDAPTNKTAKRRLDAEVPRVTQVYSREGEGGLMRCFPAQIRDRSTLTALEGVTEYYGRGIKIAPDLLEHIVTLRRGKVREICTCIAHVRTMARTWNLKTITLKDWGKEPFPAGNEFLAVGGAL